jgi:ADP-ribose pyrophosphatase YjhB (NUDIX family)
LRVKVRALIHHDGKVAVDRGTRVGKPHLALPGGRVNRWESTEAALVREVREELGIKVEPERLLYVFEATSPHRLEDLNLVFLARPQPDLDPSQLDLVDPREAAPEVLPPILDLIADRPRSRSARIAALARQRLESIVTSRGTDHREPTREHYAT